MKRLRVLTAGDVALIVALLALAGLGWALMARNHSNAQAVVYVDDAVYGRYPLDEDTTLEPKPGVVVEIAGGRYRIARSVCENQICVKQGWQTTAPVLCAPLRVMVVAEKKSEMMITR